MHLRPTLGEVGIFEIPLQGKQIQSTLRIQIIVTIRAVILDDPIQRLRHFSILCRSMDERRKGQDEGYCRAIHHFERGNQDESFLRTRMRSILSSCCWIRY